MIIKYRQYGNCKDQISYPTYFYYLEKKNIISVLVSKNKVCYLNLFGFMLFIYHLPAG